ncbi:MAG: YlbF family regulator, partial [Clostridia bacterium]|nr:YlbF family regulator [Clostridia bacterium]
MQVYDEANALARAIRESEEVRELRKAREEVESNETSRAMMKEYKKLQTRLQLAAVAGAPVADEETQRFQQMSALLFGMESTRNLMLLEMRVQQMMADVYKTLSDAAG